MCFIHFCAIIYYSCLCVFVWCLECVMYVFLSIYSIWKNRMVRFSKPDVPVLLTKSDVLICQTGLPGFVRQNICFSCFNFCELLVMCIMNYLFTHTFVAPLGCIDIGEALLDFLEKSVKCHL
jgi:hypothetical protein